MAFGAIIIGDEIMSGRRQDKHLSQLISLLKTRGLSLSWAQYLGDDRDRLTGTLRRSLATEDIVFSFGGIGVTPDDHTRQAAAAALGVELALHPEAEREIRARFGDEVTPARLQLGHFPVGAGIVPNPFNRIPGFTLGKHHFLPGFPEMAWPMSEWILDTLYRPLQHRIERSEAAIIVHEGQEGALLDLMQRITDRYPDASLFSLPSFGGNGIGRHIELGMRGAPAAVDAAMSEIRAEISRRGYEWEEKA